MNNSERKEKLETRILSSRGRLVREYRKIEDETLRDIVHLVIKALANTGFKA